MQLFLCCVLLLSFSVLCSCDSRMMLKNWSENDNRGILERMETLIDITDWPVHNFLIIFDKMDFMDVDFFVRYQNFTWKLYSAGNNNLTGFFNVILITKNFYNLHEILGAISIQGLDSQAKFVISLTEDFASLDEIKRASMGVSATMWKLDKTRVVYLVPCKGNILVMTYFPFARNCQVGELEVLDVWKDESFQNGTDLFPEKMLDVRGCAQNHSVIFHEGIELQVRKEFTETGEMIMGGVGGRLMAIVAEKMSLKLHLLSEEPESWNKLIQQIIRGESLFSIGGNFPIANLLESLDLDVGYMEESFAFGYISDGFEISWKNLMWPLSSEAWACIGCTFLLFGGLIVVVNQRYRWNITSDKFTIFHCLGIFLGSSCVLPRSYFGRYLLGMWIIYSYLINAFYTSSLVSYLTTPRENRIINTLEDLLADGIDFGGGKFHREFYNDPLDPVMMKIYNNFEIWSLDESEPRFLNGQAATGIVASYLYMYNSKKTGNGNHQLRMLKEKAFTFHVPVSMRRGSPFTVGVHRYILQAIQSGLLDYWLKYYTRISRSAAISDNTPTVITTRHLRGTLYLYTTGLICSFVTFLGEVIFHKYFSKRRCD